MSICDGSINRSIGSESSAHAEFLHFATAVRATDTLVMRASPSDMHPNVRRATVELMLIGSVELSEGTTSSVSSGRSGTYIMPSGNLATVRYYSADELVPVCA